MNEPRPSQTSRRDFLRGRAASPELTDAVLPDGEDPADRDPQAVESYLLQVGRKAMACDFQVLLNAGQHAASTEAALEALELVELLEQQLTVYRDDSEVSRLNQSAAQAPQVVEPSLFDLLARCVDLAEQTDGAFDITSAPLTKAWGFFRRQGRFPDASEVAAALACVGSRQLALNSTHHSIRFCHPEMEINLGSIGKGYALDRCAQLMTDAGINDFLMHGGRSSVIARGGRMRSDGDGWTVALRHPQRDEIEIGTFRLRDEAIGTSGCGNQFFHFGGLRYGHIIDPRSGFPAEGILSATVITDHAADADALATAMYVMGVDESRAFCERHSGCGAVLLTAGRRAGSIEIETCGDRLDAWHPA